MTGRRQPLLTTKHIPHPTMHKHKNDPGFSSQPPQARDKATPGGLPWDDAAPGTPDAAAPGASGIPAGAAPAAPGAKAAPTVNRSGRSTRRAARATAFQILYGLRFAEIADAFALALAFANSPDQHDALPPEAGGEAPYPHGFAWDLVHGVWQHHAELDAAIAAHSRNWKLERIGQVELTLLRMAAFELKYLPDVPVGAILNEALELNREFGDVASQGFVNGVLDALSAEFRAG